MVSYLGERSIGRGFRHYQCQSSFMLSFGPFKIIHSFIEYLGSLPSRHCHPLHSLHCCHSPPFEGSLGEINPVPYTVSFLTADRQFNWPLKNCSIAENCNGYFKELCAQRGSHVSTVGGIFSPRGALMGAAELTHSNTC